MIICGAAPVTFYIYIFQLAIQYIYKGNGLSSGDWNTAIVMNFDFIIKFIPIRNDADGFKVAACIFLGSSFGGA